MKVLLLAPSDAYLYNFRGPLAAALRELGHEVLLVSPPGPFGQRMLEEGFRWVEAPLVRSGINPIRESLFFFWLFRLLRRERVDLIHGFVIKGAVYGALAGRLAGVPARVASITGLGYVFLSQSLRARVLRVLLGGLFRLAFAGTGARVVVQNEDDLEFFLQNQLARPDSLSLVPGSGVSKEKFFPAGPDEKKPSESFRILLPARLLWHKGVAEFAQAAQLLKKQGRNVECLLAGEHDECNPTNIPESVLDRWAQERLVSWLGHVDDMPGLMRTVDVVVLPSYREGLPKVLVEAALCALPAVTSNVPGCREVVRDEKEGLLVPAGDPQALAHAIARLQDDPCLGFRMGEAARTRALEQFEERVIIQALFAVYAELHHGFSASRSDCLERAA